MLEIKNLSVDIEGKRILENINLTIKKGETLILFGPNGSGKSTLIKAIMGFNAYTVKQGSIVFKGKDISLLATEKRVKMGLGLMYQHPPAIRGVKLEQIAGFLNKDAKKIKSLSEELSLAKHLHRDINLGFSGGEMKRAELFQLMLQNPDLLLLDEPESGVDIENISIMGRVLSEYLSKEGKSALIITHTGYILDYVRSQRGCVLLNKQFWCVGSPKEMFETIREQGYEKCKGCVCHQMS
ncbi:ATP-binding cassette domain-containing protein [bacterium]|jgi:Fe-S cluster assembly ATP-binding protein|nr:ATP-binding cassette domain-containing protein [bacterium]